jgi:hypothetical protein
VEWLKVFRANVKVYNSEFLNISSPIGGNYAISSVNCPLNDIRYNVFTSSTDTAGGVNIAHIDGGGGINPATNSYIIYNTFTMNNTLQGQSKYKALQGLLLTFT